MIKTHIKDITLAITYRCNAHCVMCNIWKEQNHSGEFKPENLLCLPKNLQNINITGGEPFLRTDLFNIIQTIKKQCPKANIVISTNGIANFLIIKQIEKILKIAPKIGIAVSIDGIGMKHDEIRKVKGAYQKAINTINYMRERGIRNLRIAFTLGDYNVNELATVYKLSKKLKVEFSLSAIHSSKIFFNKQNEVHHKKAILEKLNWLIKQELSNWNFKKWARAYFAYGLKKFIQTGKRILPDYSGTINVFIDPQGDIYPNNVCDIKTGHLKVSANKKIREIDIPPTWMICTVRPSIKKHWIRAGWWILRNKLKF